MSKYSANDLARLREDIEHLWTFNYDGREFQRNADLKKELNSLFDANIKYVFSTNSVEINNSSIDWSACDILVVTSNKITLMTNSEWSFIKLLHKGAK